MPYKDSFDYESSSKLVEFGFAESTGTVLVSMCFSPRNENEKRVPSISCIHGDIEVFNMICDEYGFEKNKRGGYLFDHANIQPKQILVDMAKMVQIGVLLELHIDD